jgi:hypothetical protein
MLDFLGGLLVDLLVPFRVQLAFIGIVAVLALLVCLFLWIGV